MQKNKVRMMQSVQDFLIEIGTEELPPQEIDRLSIAFDKELKNLLDEKKIAYDKSAPATYFGAPRRLAVLIKDVAAQQEQQVTARQGPLVSAAYSADGKPTQAGLGFAKSCGIDMAQVTTMETDKGPKLYFEETVAGQPTEQLLAGIVEQALKKLPIKKYMRWGNGDVSFVRPVHWIVMLFGKDVVKGSIFGIATGNASYGHRILSGKAITITAPDKYEDLLEKQGQIMPNFAKRKKQIAEQIAAKALEVKGVIYQGPNYEQLLNTVTGLVEHPVALLAEFDKDFLRVPSECLISAMQDHQKCFALVDKNKPTNENGNPNLLPKFILVSNISSTDPKTIIRGNELVMHARLADASFYFDKDRKQTLESRRELLQNVTYVKKLGSVYDKTERITSLALDINHALREIPEYRNEDFVVNDAQLTRAAELCKADLLTSMVYEFPELQGLMGCYYAKHDGEDEGVALAIEDHYRPRFAEDVLPESKLGILIALADRIDTIVGMFGIGNFPTGDKDPYGLRRQATAIINILIKKDLDLPLKTLFMKARSVGGEYGKNVTAPSKEYFEFFSDRLKALYLARGIQPQTIAAVMATVSHDPKEFSKADEYRPVDIDKRITAVQNFQKLTAAASLAAANKRVQNLLEKSAQNTNVANSVNENLLSAVEEKNLYQAIIDKENTIAPLLEDQDYTGVLQLLATLQEPVDAFFNNVMVMDEDPAKRDNRLSLLQRLRNLFLKVADVSLL
jgi:glycyl-tRNA synthetase beta chain